MFVDAVGHRSHSQAIVETLVELAHNMRMQIIAEGVETFEQVVYLRDLGISSAQGYVFRRRCRDRRSSNCWMRSIRCAAAPRAVDRGAARIRGWPSCHRTPRLIAGR